MPYSFVDNNTQRRVTKKTLSVRSNVQYRHGLLTLILIAMCIVSFTTHAQEPIAQTAKAADPLVERSLIGELLEWIDRHSDHDVSQLIGNPPKITFCECGETIRYEGQSVVVHEHLQGLYDKPEATIILVKPWKASNPNDVSTLLHELTHFVQYNSKDWPCWPKTEWEAYKLQEVWLLEHGQDTEFNWIEIYFCPCPDAPRAIHAISILLK